MPGDLLVAGVGLSDVFAGAVVLVLESDEQGTLGVMLNRRSPLDLDLLLPAWSPMLSAPRVMFCGGPVEPQGALCLARLDRGCSRPPGWRWLFGDIGLLDLDQPVELATNRYSGMRVFAGYSGWGAGQLAAEMRARAWHVVPSQREDIFSNAPDGMWRQVLRRRKDHTAYFSTWTEQPQLN